MINWLKMLFHCHKWKTLKQSHLTVDHEDGYKSMGQRYYMQCEICGKVRKVDLV